MCADRVLSNDARVAFHRGAGQEVDDAGQKEEPAGAGGAEDRGAGRGPVPAGNVHLRTHRLDHRLDGGRGPQVRREGTVRERTRVVLKGKLTSFYK